MAVVRQSRRRFIVTLTAGIAVLASIGRFLRPRPARPRQLLHVALAEIPSEGALVFQKERVAIVHAGTGYFALSLVCTHLGCTVTVTPAGLFCPCHGSAFDTMGLPVKGPATSPLPRLTAEVKGDRLIVSG